MGNIFSVYLIEKTWKAVIRLTKNRRSQFYKDFEPSTFGNYQIKLKNSEKWL